jgi:hypothetical protein
MGAEDGQAAARALATRIADARMGEPASDPGPSAAAGPSGNVLSR